MRMGAHILPTRTHLEERQRKHNGSIKGINSIELMAETRTITILLISPGTSTEICFTHSIRKDEEVRRHALGKTGITLTIGNDKLWSRLSVD